MLEPRQVPTASIRLAAIERCEDLIRSGWGRKTRSLNRAAQEFGISTCSLWRWHSWVAGAPLSERAALLSSPVQTRVDETLKAFRALWSNASASGRAAILNDLAGRSLPKRWSVVEADRG